MTARRVWELTVGIWRYFAKRKLSPLCKTLDFTRASSWDESLKAYLGSLGRLSPAALSLETAVNHG